MHIHILGICGTFMGGIARLAIEADHTVSGVDRVAYPPMSDQLAALGIHVEMGFDQPLPDADLVVVGNSMTRGMPVIEELLRTGRPYVSGPEWLRHHILHGRHVIAVAGTHGKTTTTSILAWILAQAGKDPGFLVGGVPGNFSVSARMGTGPFVVEADEYDTAFFDKRAKFVHYPAHTLVLNNLEFDHADIYPDVNAIVRQFHHAVRLVPDDGTVVCAASQPNLDEALEAGCWSPIERFDVTDETASPHAWHGRRTSDDGTRFKVMHAGAEAARVTWPVPGVHNVSNALAAIAAAASVGVAPATSAQALTDFQLPARRLELRHNVHDISVLLDFAHHPTAIDATIATLRAVHKGRVLVVVEPRSNTMRAGVHGDTLGTAIRQADRAWILGEFAADFAGGGIPTEADEYKLARVIAAEARAGDVVALLSNGNLTTLADAIAGALQQRFTE